MKIADVSVLVKVFLNGWDEDLDGTHTTFATGINWEGQKNISNDQITSQKDVSGLKGYYFLNSFVEI